MNRIIEKIALEKLGIESLETNHADAIDFHEVATWNLREAL